MKHIHHGLRSFYSLTIAAGLAIGAATSGSSSGYAGLHRSASFDGALERLAIVMMHPQADRLHPEESRRVTAPSDPAAVYFCFATMSFLILS